MNELAEKIQSEIKKVIIGKDDVIKKVLMAVLAQGHVLMEDVPGTGKTTVARMIARIYKSLGIIPTSRCVEVGRTDLVEGYMGQTAKKTTKVVESALGGVLFIDEAYQLIQDGENGFGKEDR